MFTKKNVIGFTVLFAVVALPLVALATDTYQLMVPWSGGAGQKPFGYCDNSGYFASAIANEDFNNNNQGQRIKCTNAEEFIPSGVSAAHDSCVDIAVPWRGGTSPKLKTPAMCPNGKYAVGFAIFDAGSNNQYVNKMRCCEMSGMETQWGDTTDTVVEWFGGFGLKPFASCQPGFFITGIQNADWGKNNQSVANVWCAEPEEVE